MSKTVRGITLKQWEIVRHHLIMDLRFGGEGTYLDYNSESSENTPNYKDMEITRSFIEKMDKAFGVSFSEK